ncbi:MAG: hypothetical protein DMF69_11335 [Acidobacteria bacterium]|nr:MAG: hypothetical protein DMF69_11335 [Acidobacteriota bacterium]
MSEWVAGETTTHQDHVIAHVLGATVEAYLVWDETAFLLLDIGFIWNIYLDGEMGLVPKPMAINELTIDEAFKSELRQEADEVSRGNSSSLKHLTASPEASPIQSVEFYVHENSRRLVMTCEGGQLVVETSLETAEVKIYGY